MTYLFCFFSIRLKWFLKVDNEKTVRLSCCVWSVKWVKGVHRPHYKQPHKSRSAKQLLFYYWISSQASWTELDLLDHVFFLNLVWNILQHSVKIQSLWIQWWVFKYTLGQISLTRRQSMVYFSRGVSVVFGTLNDLSSSVFCISRGETLFSFLCMFIHVFRYARPHTHVNLYLILSDRCTVTLGYFKSCIRMRTACLQYKWSPLQPFYYVVSVLFRLCYDYSINLHFTTAGNMRGLSGIEERL